jgi:hypothetical protein
VLSHDDVAMPVVDALKESPIKAQLALGVLGVMIVVGVLLLLLLLFAACVSADPPPPHAAMSETNQTATNLLL